jgi:hypothetical protein
VTALIVGTLLALLALGVVLYPLFVPPRVRERRGAARPALARENAVEALREIEFDRATGKLSDADYAALKRTYTERALAEMRATDAVAAADGVIASPEDAAEAAVLRLRARQGHCPDCGPRTEPDALWCSNCGRYLPGACADCGAPVDEIGARYCGGCGGSLAA